MTLSFRSASPDDISTCIDIRGKTRENAVSVARLREFGVTLESWRHDVATGKLLGHVCLDDEAIVGYCFGDSKTGEVVVLALLPPWEGKGLGKQLLNRVVADLAQLGFKRVFLGCSSNPNVRSHGFYRHLGWVSTGTFDKLNDEVLEYFPDRVADRD
jgi:GNAT superfamily N-acetyltransferase